MKSVRETLAGRAFIYSLWPLMLCEVLGGLRSATPEPPLLHAIQQADGVGTILSKTPSLLNPELATQLEIAQDHILRWGGMPELLSLDDDDREQWHRAYLETFLQRDLADLARLADLSPFAKFLKLSALRTPGLLSYSELARDAGIAPDTARRYLEYLRISYQAFLLQPYSVNLTSSVIKTPKLYWCDIGIMRFLSGRVHNTDGAVFGVLFVEIYCFFHSSALSGKAP